MNATITIPSIRPHTQATEATSLTRVLLIDEQQMFVDTMQGLIEAEPDLSVVATSTSDQGLIELLDHHKPHVVVVTSDVAGNGAVVAGRLRLHRPQTHVLMLMEAANAHFTREAIAVGCLGVVAKERSAADLLNAIRAVARGQAVAAVTNLDAIFGNEDATQGSASGLTARQLEILQLMAKGLSTDALAEHLYVSRNTIRSHVHQILTKLDARSKLEAVAKARRLGVVV